MIYAQYDIELVRLEAENIELLRQWRNAPEIVKNMEFQEYITSEMQVKWFQKINDINNFYFLIRKNKEWIGMIHLSAINYHKNTADAGIFISKQSYINTSIPAHASFALLDFAFDDLKLKSIYIKVHKNNKKALKYNQHLGFLYTEESLNPSFIIMKLSNKNYTSKTLRIKRIITNVYPDPKSVLFNSENKIDLQIKDRFFS